MPTDKEFWLPSLPPHEQKWLNARRKRTWQTLANRMGFPGKTLWDWLQLLAILAIPLVVACATGWFSDQQYKNSTQLAQEQRRDQVLQTYLDRISDLLMHNGLHDPPKNGSEVRSIAEALTMTTLPQLDGTRKGRLIQFLYDADLIDDYSKPLDRPVLLLQDADLTGIKLSNAPVLSFVDLTHEKMSNAQLDNTFLRYANLTYDDLTNANLTNTDLTNAKLPGANLTNANLTNVNLSGANLSSVSSPIPGEGPFIDGANLTNANLIGADLSGADLSGVVLKNAKITDEQLREAKSLRGAIMPNGSKHP